jgi:chromosome segregation ATPase
MERLEAALARFSAALESLENCLVARPKPGREGDAASELAALKREREHLLKRVTALEEESSSLAGLTEAVESRLDGAIAEIRSVLGRN